MEGNGLDLQKLFAMQAQLQEKIPPVEGVTQEVFEVSYIRKDGRKDVRSVRLNIPSGAKKPMSLIYVPHYEMKEDAIEIRDYLLKGWAVASCADFQNDYNAQLTYDDLVFNNAALYMLRNRNDIDRDRIAIVGGSAGGYMAMMLSALQLGICCSVANGPICNVYFNFYRYFEEANKYNLMAVSALSEDEKKDTIALLTKSPLPFLSAICTTGTFTKQLKASIADFSDMSAWEAISPTAFYDCYSNPIYINQATSDLLVPIDQLTRDYTYEKPGKTLPEGFSYRLGDYEGVLGHSLCELLDPSQLNLFKSVPVDGSDVVPFVFDEDKQFNVCITDEGAPEAFASHSLGLHTGRRSDVNYLEFMFEKGAKETNILSPEKLLLFAERYAGKAKQLVGHNGEGVYGTLDVYRKEIIEELKAWKIANGKETFQGVCNQAVKQNPEYADVLHAIESLV